MTYYTLTYGASSSFVTAAQLDRELRRVASVFPDRAITIRRGWAFEDRSECEELRVVGPDHRNVSGLHDPGCTVNDY